jgi:hypothetical protein
MILRVNSVICELESGFLKPNWTMFLLFWEKSMLTLINSWSELETTPEQRYGDYGIFNL